MQKLIALSKIEQACGLRTKTMLFRLKQGKYSNAVKDNRGRWLIPAEDAIRTVAEWLEKKDLIPLQEVAAQCGLKERSLNPRISDGTVKAFCVEKRWFVSFEEARRLEEFYKHSVSTGEAARILGYTHRTYVHGLIKRGLSFLQIGKEKRIRKCDIASLQKGKMELKHGKTLPNFSKELGLNLDWSERHPELCGRVTFQKKYNEGSDGETKYSIFYEGSYLCTVPYDLFNELFRRHETISSDPMKWDGEICLVLHAVVQALFDNRAKVETQKTV